MIGASIEIFDSVQTKRAWWGRTSASFKKVRVRKFSNSFLPSTQKRIFAAPLKKVKNNLRSKNGHLHFYLCMYLEWFRVYARILFTIHARVYAKNRSSPNRNRHQQKMVCRSNGKWTHGTANSLLDTDN